MLKNLAEMKNYLAALLFAASPVFCISQNSGLPINISLFNESTAIPFTQFFTTPVHPGIQIGTEFNYKTKAHSRLFQTVNISYFYHNNLAQGAGIHTDLGYELRAGFGLSFTGFIGLGYMHTWATNQEYTFVDGQYEKRRDKGNGRVIPSVGLELGYYITPGDTQSSKIFVRYQGWAEYPYSPGFIPLMTHINLHLGYKFFIGKN